MDVTKAGTERLEEFASLFARSFADDAMIGWPFHHHDVEERARKMWLAGGRDMVEEGWIWEIAPAVGFAAWVQPGGGERYQEIEQRSRDEIAELTDDGCARFAGLWGWIEENLPAEPHWYLDHIAVEAEQRGNGLGSALIHFGLEQARRDGTCAFLETSREGNVGIYEHLGFRVVHADHVPGGGPFIWFMRWDPAWRYRRASD